MKRSAKRAVLVASGVASTGLAFLAGHAWAGGIPSTGALRYSGTLTNAAGEPLADDHPIQIDLWADPEPGTTPLCHTESVETLQDGRFSMLLGDDCVEAIKNNPEVWAEVLVDGVSLGTSRLGAVPYAVEAAHAIDADLAERAKTADSAGGTLATEIVPSGMIGMFAGPCPPGWSPCNGTVACPDLNDAYVKGGSEFAAQTGSNTHSHLISGLNFSGASGGTPTTSSVKVGPTGAHNHVTMAEFSDKYVYENASLTFLSGGNNVAVPAWTSSHRIEGAAGWHDSTALTAEKGVLTTTEPAHSHSVEVELQALPAHTHAIPSFNTSTESHEPRSATLVFCMKE